MRPKLAPHRDSFETIPLTPLSNDQSANPARTPYQDYEMKYPSPILTGVPSNRKLPPTPFAGEAGFSSRSTARSVYPHQNWAKDGT